MAKITYTKEDMPEGAKVLRILAALYDKGAREFKMTMDDDSIYKITIEKVKP